MSSPSPLFVTGTLRSGTTLLEKLLCSHPDMSVLYQPLFPRMIAAKRAFLASIGLSGEPLPLSHYFGEERYHPGQLTSFLDHRQFSLRELDPALEPAAQADGPLFQPRVLGEWLHESYWSLRHRDAPLLYGAKEVLCEEFAPHLLNSGFKVLLVLRDPRDVLTSLNFGRGAEFGGRPRPTLFNLQNWRKSVAFALHLESHPAFLWLRYEDLALRRDSTLSRIAAFLGLSPEPWFAGDFVIHDQSGLPWSGNSSHQEMPEVTGDSVFRFESRLSVETIALAEAVCEPEMRELGYERRTKNISLEQALSEFREAVVIDRAEFDPLYSSAPRQVALELERSRTLDDPKSSSRTGPLFLFPELKARLRSTPVAASAAKDAPA